LCNSEANLARCDKEVISTCRDVLWSQTAPAGEQLATSDDDHDETETECKILCEPA
jgi:hypothetical protein